MRKVGGGGGGNRIRRKQRKRREGIPIRVYTSLSLSVWVTHSLAKFAQMTALSVHSNASLDIPPIDSCCIK